MVVVKTSATLGHQIPGTKYDVGLGRLVEKFGINPRDSSPMKFREEEKKSESILLLIIVREFRRKKSSIAT